MQNSIVNCRENSNNIVMIMLKKLIIKNFRCYVNSTISFQENSILVGRNNAGKSTLIESLKIISTVARRYKTLRFAAPPRGQAPRPAPPRPPAPRREEGPEEDLGRGEIRIIWI